MFCWTISHLKRLLRNQSWETPISNIRTRFGLWVHGGAYITIKLLIRSRMWVRVLERNQLRWGGRSWSLRSTTVGAERVPTAGLEQFCGSLIHARRRILDHPNIKGVYAFGTFENSVRWVALSRNRLKIMIETIKFWVIERVQVVFMMDKVIGILIFCLLNNTFQNEC